MLCFSEIRDDADEAEDYEPAGDDDDDDEEEIDDDEDAPVCLFFRIMSIENPME
jgi:hypothetical protein